MVAPYTPYKIAEKCKMYTPIAEYKEVYIKVIMEDELKGESLGSLKHTDESKIATIMLLLPIPS